MGSWFENLRPCVLTKVARTVCLNWVCPVLFQRYFSICCRVLIHWFYSRWFCSFLLEFRVVIVFLQYFLFCEFFPLFVFLFETFSVFEIFDFTWTWFLSPSFQIGHSLMVPFFPVTFAFKVNTYSIWNWQYLIHFCV